MNRSREERRRQPVKPEIGRTWVVVGLLLGLLVGFIVELAWRRAAIIMLAGGLAGALSGAVVEGARFWHRRRKFRRARKS